jgi:alkanesulfonate monooxygenase SsuD/methylene tetrahydromethanopterin reductase-like flavin-dependent oxidoreductase (luciferase family)
MLRDDHGMTQDRSMQFSAMTMNMFFPGNDDPDDDHRIIDMAVEQSIWFAELGYHVWFTDHHFRGPWHSNPLQFAAYVAPLIPRDRYIGFGVLSIPFYHPVRLVESMNLLDHLTKGKVLFGVGSGWQGTEPTGLGVDAETHASGQLAEQTLDVMVRLWDFNYGDPEYSFSVGANSGRIKRRLMPAPYSKPYPTLIRVATREAGIVRAAQKGWPVFVGVLGADLR